MLTMQKAKLMLVTDRDVRLSCREKQVVDLVRCGKANKVIAFELQLAIGTIKEYIFRIFRKLNVSNRTELAVWAMTQQRAAAVGTGATYSGPAESL